MEERINDIHTIIKELYPEATSVDIFVNCEGIEVSPRYKTNAVDFSMKTITGEWIKKAEKE